MTIFLISKWKEWQLASSFLTRLPVADIDGELPPLNRCFWAFPVLGMVIGSVVYAIFSGLSIIGFPALIASFVAIGAGVLLTGGLHEDGCADMFDGLGGGHDRHAKLAIMKDSHLGSYAVIGLIIVIAIKAVSLGSLTPTIPDFISVMVLAGASRFFMVSALSLMPPAREDGLGHQFASKINGQRVNQLLPPLLIILTVSFFAPSYVLAVIFMMGMIAMAVGWLAYRQIGGQTGDICGAIQLISETAGLAVLVVLAG